MCNRYRLSASQREIAERYGVELPYPEDVTFPPGELFPKRSAWIVTNTDAGRALDIAIWGFPPPKGGRAPVTNVRNYASPMWRNSLRDPNCRCLVPFSDFCEWAGEPGSKVAHWFSTPASPISSFAGIWRSTSEGTVFAFLTCGYEGDPSAHPVGAIHPKACPVVLHREDEDRWLSANVEDALSLACPHPSQLLAVSS